MPATERRETALIKLFVSAYQDGAWTADPLHIPDKETDRGVDGFVKRASDGLSLAIEHTLIQPFLDDKKDFAFFEKYLLPIERDKTLAADGRITWVYVKTGSLKPGAEFSVVSASIHEWLKRNVKQLPLGTAWFACPIEATGQAVSLLTKVYADSSFHGTFRIRRFDESETLGVVVEKVLREKLPKLANTVADERILLLEREQLSLSELSIWSEIESRRSGFPPLREVKLWFAETVFYAKDGVVEFKRYDDGKVACRLEFFNGRLITRVENGIATIVERV